MYLFHIFQIRQRCQLRSGHVRTHTYSYMSSTTPSLYLLCMGMLGVWGVGEGVLALPSPSVAGPEPLRTTPSRSESLVVAGRAEKRRNGEGGKKSERKRQGSNLRDGGHKTTQKQQWKMWKQTKTFRRHMYLTVGLVCWLSKFLKIRIVPSYVLTFPQVKVCCMFSSWTSNHIWFYATNLLFTHWCKESSAVTQPNLF